MNKLMLTISLLICSTIVVFAQKYMTRTGKVSFNASAPGAPDVVAVNNEAASILDAKSGDVVFQVLVKSFKFERALMQEHFNENYMESDKYPKSEFKANVTNISSVNFASDGSYNVKVTGKLTIHGVTNPVSVPGVIVVKGKTVTIKATFAVRLSEYKISIPGLVSDKVAKDAKISVDSDLAEK